MVGRNAVHRAIQQRSDHRLPVRLRAQRRIHLRVRVVVADRLIGQREVMRRRLAGHMQAVAASPRGSPPAPAPSTHAAHADAAAASRRARSPAAAGCRAPQSATPPPPASRAAPAGTPPARVHAASARQPRILRMLRDRHAQLAPQPPAPRASRRPRSTGLPSSVKPTAPAATSACKVRQLLAHAAERRRRHRQQIHAPPPRSASSIHSSHVDRIVHRHRVRHRHHGRESARRGGSRPRRDRLLVRLPGLAQMHMHIDQARRDHASRGVDL